ncbi:hypothetical protein ABBQ38_003284 [Trebouxia sp. C0009 RCD-2024]
MQPLPDKSRFIIWAPASATSVESAAIQKEFAGPSRDAEVSGYITQYKGLAFMTFKAAGHRVPSDAPEDAYIMFTNYVADTFNATTIYTDFEGGLQSSIGIQ